MGVKQQHETVLAMGGRLLNAILSLIVFSVLDVVDLILCYAYKLADFVMEAEWKQDNRILQMSGQGESKILRLTNSSKLQLEEISDTLYTRRSFLRRRSATFTVNSTVVQMLQGRIGPHRSSTTLHLHIPRWSDCHCTTCTSWTSSCKQTLFVKADGAIENGEEDVLFIHGFISSSAFWSETVYPHFSKSAKSKYRLLAVDLLGFGRSPKPSDSLYTLREHLEMIEKSVLEAYNVKSFHIVAHSLGCILALALAIKHPLSLKSLTLLAPPYFPAPKGEVQVAQYTMRRIAPRRVWPMMTFAASIGCWYEHITRTFSLVLSKNHRLWEFLTKLLTRNRYLWDGRSNSYNEKYCLRPDISYPFLLDTKINVRMRTYLIDCFFLHTHNAAWHTLHNIICGSAGKIEGYLEEVKRRVKCDIRIFHGADDDLIPVECSYKMQSRISGAKLKVVKNVDHLTIVVGRQKAFARELEHIWDNATATIQ